MKKLILLATTLAVGATLASLATAQGPAGRANAKRVAQIQAAQAGNLQRAGRRRGGVLPVMLRRAGATPADIAAIRDYVRAHNAARRAYVQAVKGPLEVLRNRNAGDADYAAAAGAIGSARANYISQINALQQALFGKITPRAQVAFFATEVAHRLGGARLASTGAAGQAAAIDEEDDISQF